MANSIQRLKEGAESRSVLIIDDDPEIAESLSRILRVFFREYVIASDGEEALALFYDRFKASDPFTLVVTDLELPKLGGLRLIREIRALSPSQPVVILSAHDEANFMAEAIAQNVQGYLLKPLAMPKLFSTLEKVFSLENVADSPAESAFDPITGWSLFPALTERIGDHDASAVTLMRLRVNHFNNIISFVGEEYANEYLSELSRLLESLVFEPKGEFFRTATDEFCLLFEGEHTDYAAELAGNMTSVVRYFHTSERGIILNSTLSVGIASGSDNVLL
ncbi:MAG: response regulator, partial [Campylobacterota bacterium]